MVLSELIKEYKEMCLEYVPVEEVLEDLQKLEGIYKPKDVPQFVVDWYEEHKDDFEGELFRCIDCIPGLYDEEELNDFEEWVVDSGTKPFQTLVNMHQFGYEVEKEKRYLVKMKGLEIDEAYLKFQLDDKYWYMGIFEERKHARVKHTKTELEEARFEDVFNSPLFKVEEVVE